MPDHIFLCPTVELAQAKAQELRDASIPFATVEAEYGSVVIEGTHATLAHHTGEWRKMPAPCNADVAPLPEGGCVIISHIDLDTLGGVLALFESKPAHDTFWKAAEYIDLNGPHRIHDLSERDRDLMRGYWAATQERPALNRTLVTEVSSEISRLFNILQDLLGPGSLWSQGGMVEAGREWAERQERKVEACLVEEDDFVRVFASDDTFTAASYFSPRVGRLIPATVSMNTNAGSITIACMDNRFDACAIAQSLWGPTAGGHPGIAGSPRGDRMCLSDLVEAVNAVHDALTGDNSQGLG